MNAAKMIDVRGQTCPHPLLKAGKTLREITPGQILEVLLDYRPTAERGIPDFCKKYDCDYEVKEEEGFWRFFIEKSDHESLNIKGSTTATIKEDIARYNCWEYKNCGREQGGANTEELGVCIASTETRADGMNRGTKGGRACWAIAGTLCDGEVQGTFAMKSANCMRCDFYRLVAQQEGKNYQDSKDIIEKLS